MAARQIGLQQIPCIRLAHLTDMQRRAYVIADNKLAELSGWDDEMLAAEFRALQADGFDLDLVGFGEKEIAELIADDPVDVDGSAEVAPEPPAIPVSALGDIWILGLHRIICGDSTDAATVARVLAGAQPHLMVTDPPYGVEYDPTRTSNNKKKAGAVLNDDRADWRRAWKLFAGDVAYVWHATLHTISALGSLEACGFEYRAMIVWVKDRFTLGRGHYHWRHESAWYVVRNGSSGHWCGARDQDTVWNIKAREDAGHGHGTQKPIECMRRPIENNSARGDAIYEPFSGSGTTIIAGEMTGRRVYAIELSPAYVDVAVRRWQEFTGQHATLEGTDQTFDQLAQERAIAQDAA